MSLWTWKCRRSRYQSSLGGEPEDREPSRDSNGFEIRRPGTQPPIQRGNDMFGPSLNSQQSFGATNGSIGSRTMTPQQQQLALRPGGGFADQLPPGIVPSTMSMYQQQQQQGHGRQSSRFPFGGDNSGSGQVKLAANPRSMAQQASHMQSGFQSQAGAGPFYGTTMPAPPPGLKSTGTPPAGFAQGHGFANAGFGAPKESASSTDLLNHLIRGRNGPQAHDAAKRELMLSSFSSHAMHHPLARDVVASARSSPRPASPGLPRPSSAFAGSGSDGGSGGTGAAGAGSRPGDAPTLRQKRKGKKQRNANTSSVGGSGLVDLADPSILLMQHQQGNASANPQSLYGGQAQQGGFTSNLMYGSGSGTAYGGRW
jgi:CCR4-NOT transcription complex subunit 4